MLHKYYCYDVKLDAIKWWNPLPAACWCRQIWRALINPTGHYASAGRRTVWSMALRDRFMAELWQWSDRWVRLRPDSCSHFQTPVHSTRHAFLNQPYVGLDVQRHFSSLLMVLLHRRYFKLRGASVTPLNLSFYLILRVIHLSVFCGTPQKPPLVKLCPLMAREEKQS